MIQLVPITPPLHRLELKLDGIALRGFEEFGEIDEATGEWITQCTATITPALCPFGFEEINEECIPICPPDLEAWKEERRTSSWVTDQLQELERGWAAMDVPDTKAFYGRVTAGSDGTIWMSGSMLTPDSTRLFAFGSDGVLLGKVAVPGTFVPFDSGPGWVVGLFRGEADVEFIHLYELEIS